METFDISIEGSKEIFTLAVTGDETKTQIIWPSEDTFYEASPGSKIRFIKKSSGKTLGSSSGYSISSLRLKETDPLFATLGATLTPDEFKTWAEENLGFKTASGGSEATTDASELTSGVLADARVPQSAVTQYRDNIIIPDGYITPRAYGAVMDGVTDDRDAFVATLAAADSLGLRVAVDRDMFLDMEERAVKSIFLEAGTYIEGFNNPNIIINNDGSVAFYIVLTENVTLKGFTFLWDQSYNASEGSDGSNTENAAVLKSYMAANRNLTYSSGNPKINSFNSGRAIISIDASKNVLLEDVTFKAKGTNANSFIPWGIKLKEQHAANQTNVAEGAALTAISDSLHFKNLVFDGTLMAIQGVAKNSIIEGIKSYRYSDWQAADGTLIGGNSGDDNYKFPPPHLMYLNDDSSVTGNHCENIKIINTIDYGIYVGSPNVRATVSGYCVSLTVTGTHDNLYVENYKSYRRDGLLGIQDMSNSTFQNIYTEYDSSIFATLGNNDFNNVRFVGTLNNVRFDNIVIKDLSEEVTYSPLDVSNGSNVQMNNVHVYVKELTLTPSVFGFSGSNNRITNSSFNIENHSATNTFIAPVSHSTTARNSGANNHYEVTLNGWRSIASDPPGLIARSLFQSATNPNNNYFKINDTKNNIVIENRSGIISQKWTRSEIKTLTSGTNSVFTINIPRYFKLNKITTQVTTEVAGVTISLGTSTVLTDNLVAASDLSPSVGVYVHEINETTANNSAARAIYIHANGGSFTAGVVKLVIELERISTEGTGDPVITKP